MKKKTIKILSIILGIMIVLSLIVFISFLSFDRAGGEIGFDAVINRVEPEYNMAYATVTDQDAGFFSKKLPESIMFNTSDLDVELKVGDEIQGCYLSGTISGDSVRVVSVMVKEKKTATDGTITFYTEPVREAQSQEGTDAIEELFHRELTYEETRKLIKIIDDVDEWVDDHSVDRLSYYFDGAFWLYEKDHVFYFTYEYNVIYYDHYYAEIPAEDMQYIKDLGAECVELPDVEPTE